MSAAPFHGKLLWDEDPNELGDRGFATSTGEQFLFEIDLETKTQVTKYDFSGDLIPDSGCLGLHAIAYSAVNNHVYAECSEGGGTLEFDVSNDGIAFVHQHLNVTGALDETPDGGAFVVASNTGANLLHVFTPSGSGIKSSIETEVKMQGHPSAVSFLSNGKGGKADYIACAPLTENINQKNRRDGEIVCDYYVGCTGATT